MAPGEDIIDLLQKRSDHTKVITVWKRITMERPHSVAGVYQPKPSLWILVRDKLAELYVELEMVGTSKTIDHNDPTVKDYFAEDGKYIPIPPIPPGTWAPVHKVFDLVDDADVETISLCFLGAWKRDFDLLDESTPDKTPRGNPIPLNPALVGQYEFLPTDLTNDDVKGSEGGPGGPVAWLPHPTGLRRLCVWVDAVAVESRFAFDPLSPEQDIAIHILGACRNTS